MFDNGSLKEDPVKSHEMIDRLLFKMQEGNELRSFVEEFPLIQVINSVWDRIVQVSRSLKTETYVAMVTNLESMQGFT